MKHLFLMKSYSDGVSSVFRSAIHKKEMLTNTLSKLFCPLIGYTSYTFMSIFYTVLVSGYCTKAMYLHACPRKPLDFFQVVVWEDMLDHLHMWDMLSKLLFRDRIKPYQDNNTNMTKKTDS